MERMIGLLLIISAIWIGVEFYTEGDQAFGGIFASDDAPAVSLYEDERPAAAEPRSHGARPNNWAGERVRQKVTGLNQQRGDRIDAVED
jgi:hypothetical protein